MQIHSKQAFESSTSVIVLFDLTGLSCEGSTSFAKVIPVLALIGLNVGFVFGARVVVVDVVVVIVVRRVVLVEAAAVTTGARLVVVVDVVRVTRRGVVASVIVTLLLVLILTGRAVVVASLHQGIPASSTGLGIEGEDAGGGRVTVFELEGEVTSLLLVGD